MFRILVLSVYFNSVNHLPLGIAWSAQILQTDRDPEEVGMFLCTLKTPSHLHIVLWHIPVVRLSADSEADTPGSLLSVSSISQILAHIEHFTEECQTKRMHCSLRCGVGPQLSHCTTAFCLHPRGAELPSKPLGNKAGF